LASSGNKIAYVRKKRGYTQQDIRDLVFQKTGKKYRQGTISSWETGKTSPGMEVLEALASILGVSVDDLYEKDQEEDSRSDSKIITSNDLARFEQGLRDAQKLFEENNEEDAYLKLEGLYKKMLNKIDDLSEEYDRLQSQLRAVREITRL